MSTYAEMRREDAARSLALRRRVEATGDTDLMRLLERYDSLRQNEEMGQEIRAEWAADARRILELIPDSEKPGCPCDVCAMTYALRATIALLVDSGHDQPGREVTGG